MPQLDPLEHCDQARVFSVEERLLLDCASVKLDCAGKQRVQAATEGALDWSRIAKLADRHRLTPLVCKTLEEICPEVLDHPEARILRVRTRAIAERNLQLTREMILLVKLLESHGIPLIPLKGPVLAMTAFGSLSSREFADIDLLVHSKDLNRACALLDSRKYKEDMALPPRQLAAYIRWQHALTYQRGQDGIAVELHWRLHDRYLSFPLSESALWAKSVTGQLFGTQIRCLSPEHNFIYLCMHGAKHYWERVEWISCLNALARVQSPKRWPGIIAEAGRLRSTRLLQLGLALAHKLSPSPATQLPLDQMDLDTSVNDLVATVWRHIFAEEICGAYKEVYRLRFYLKAREHLRDRLRLVWTSSVRIPHPQSSTWNGASLPDSLSFLYYILRPIAVMRKFGFRGLRGVLRA